MEIAISSKNIPRSLFSVVMWELWVARHFFHQGVKNIGQLADVLIRLEKYTDILGMELTMSVHNLRLL